MLNKITIKYGKKYNFNKFSLEILIKASLLEKHDLVKPYKIEMSWDFIEYLKNKLTYEIHIKN